MKISTCSHRNPEIEILEINGDLTGRGALKFEEYLYSSLDEGRFFKVINLKYMKKADGLGLNVLQNLINRGMRIRLFNAGSEMLKLLRISRKEEVIKLYNCQEPDEAVLLFEKEFLDGKNSFKHDVKKRRFKRVNTSLQAKFKSHTVHNSRTNHNTIIKNLSEGGILISHVHTVIEKTEERLNALEMVNRKLYDITFSLNGGTKMVETNGESVWVVNGNQKPFVGVRFQNLKLNLGEMIRDYVYRHKEN
ncbi:MAG: hypothetical protein SCALA701_30940 [Candidatus Scalindua sp.]|nr:hypothetical protein [Planctomycetota bacterium]GJQ60293.1 MAG: hypothetical protein SCALA701_30940 [Candidatus Scalindua sp.]